MGHRNISNKYTDHIMSINKNPHIGLFLTPPFFFKKEVDMDWLQLGKSFLFSRQKKC